MDRYSEKLVESTDLMGYVSRLDNFDMLHVSDVLLKGLNMTEDDYKGKKCYEVIHNRTTPCHFCNNSKLKLGEFYKWYAYNPLMDAHLVVRDTLVKHEEFGEVRLEICYEITNEVAQIQQLQSHASIDKAIIECAKTLLDDDTIDEAMADLLVNLCTHFDGTRCYIYEGDSEKDILKLTYEYNNPEKELLKDITKETSYSRVSQWLETMKNNDEVYINSEMEEVTNKYSKMLLKDQSAKSILIVPLRRNGHIIGVVGITDPTDNLDNLGLIKTISGFIVNNLEKRDMIEELETLSYVDKLTGLKNRNCYINAIDKIKQTPPQSLAVIFADVNGLKKVNDNLGHQYGDTLIRWCANFLSKYIKSPIFRIGGDEFICFIDDIESDDFYDLLQKMRSNLAEVGMINMSMGGTWHDKDIDVEQQIVETDKIMYLEKQKFYVLKKYNHMNLETELIQLKEDIMRLEKELI